MADIIPTAMAAIAADRNPLSYSWDVYAWVSAWAAIGGLVNFYQKVKQGAARALNFTELLGEMVTSAFVGIGTFFICEAAGVGGLWSAVLIAITGHMGSRAIFVAENLLQKFVPQWFGSKLGVIVNESGDPIPPAEVKQEPVK